MGVSFNRDAGGGHAGLGAAGGARGGADDRHGARHRARFPICPADGLTPICRVLSRPDPAQGR
jgi:hypothetical protein